MSAIRPQPPPRARERPAGAAGLFAWLFVRLRFAIVAFWVGLAVFVTLELPTIREAQVGSLGDLVPSEADAIDAELRSSELFRFPLLSRTLVVQRDAGGLSLAEQGRVLRRALALSRDEYPGLRRVGGALPVINTLGGPPFSRERSTTAITYLFFPEQVGQNDRVLLAERFVERRIEPEYEGFTGVTGALAARSTQADEIERALPFVTLATVVLVMLVVGIHFRALGAPLANLAAVACAYLVSIRLIAWLGQQLGVSVPREVEPVVVVLLFGVVTDYSIFFLSRIRRRMAEGEDPRVATLRGTAELLPIVVTAGLTVVAAAGSLFVAELGFFRAFGPGMAMAILFGLLVAISLMPALLAIGGRALFWPRRPGIELTMEATAEEAPAGVPPRPRRSRAIALATTRPWATAAACAALLLAGASGLLRTELGNPLIRGLPERSEAREAYRQAARGFAPGILSPTVVLVEAPGVAGQRRELASLQQLLARQPGVVQVVGPADQPTARPFGAVLSRTGDAARFFLVFSSDPLGAAAIQDMMGIRARAPSLLDRAGLATARASFAGDTVLVAETIEKSSDDLGRVAPVALLVVLAILVLFLRALVAPLYLLGASLLSLAASLGLATYVFQDLVGHGEITYYVPFAAAVLLVSLGSDYNVFLVGRIWAEASRRPLGQAVRVAGSRAATPIAIAGLVLAGSFALLALVPLRPFRELAFTVATGLLIDAFLVRTLFVPALITIFGHKSGWPGGRLARKGTAGAAVGHT